MGVCEYYAHFCCPYCSSSFFIFGNSPLFISSVVPHVLESGDNILAEIVGSCCWRSELGFKLLSDCKDICY